MSNFPDERCLAWVRSQTLYDAFEHVMIETGGLENSKGSLYNGYSASLFIYDTRSVISV